MRAVVLAGGRGTRLAPYTTVLPKPLMPLGDKPVLERLILQLRKAGIRDVVLSVGYLAQLIEAYFGDGGKWGMRFNYSRENTPLGTAGPLGLVEGLEDTFLVMNGDLVTDLDFSQIVDFHLKRGAEATIAVKPLEVRIPLGVVEVDGGKRITGYKEKPAIPYRASMGFYVFEPSVLSLLPQGERMDMPELIVRTCAAGKHVAAFEFSGYWLDIGRVEDYQQAIADSQQGIGSVSIAPALRDDSGDRLS